MDRLDISLPYDNALVILCEHGSFYIRLLRSLHGQRIYATRKLPIRGEELRNLVETTNFVRVDLGELQILSDAGHLGIKFEHLSLQASRASVYGPIRRFLEQAS